MIISASRRTDIPAFYSKWFMERIKQGYYIKVNPFNTKQKKIVSLRPEDVDCIVFWTKYPKPLMEDLHLLDDANCDQLFQFASELSTIAEKNDLKIYSCAEKMDLEAVGIQHGACIDLQLIQDIFRFSLKGKKDRNQRDECLCAVSEEMGTYDTCQFHCSYCYAVRSEKMVQRNLAKHHWQSPLLVGNVETEPFNEM